MNESSLLGMVLNSRYRIEKELGRGGFGAVFLAIDQQLKDRPVVIKVLLDQGAADGWFRRKFSQEIEALTRVDHPGIVSVIDTGELPERQPFMVQQFVEGITLREAIPLGGMDLKRAARIIRKLGQALSAAHQKGIIHRDLKPDNIILRRHADGSEHPVIIDFGISSVVDFPEEELPEKTKITGTFTYMAPEQFDGKPSPASDIYALGILSFELLAGAPPSSGKPLFELMLMQKEGNWPRISEMRPSVPEAAQALILRALSRKPEDRYSSASQFGEEFSRNLVSSMIETGEIPPQELVTSKQPSYQWVWLTAAGIVVIALLAVAASVKSPPPPPRSKIENTAPPTVSLPLPEQIYNYWITGQKSTGEKFDHPHEQTYQAGDRISIEVEFSQSGYFYAISQASELFNGLPVYSSLYPTARTKTLLPRVDKGMKLRLPEGRRITFQKNQTMEYVWLIFSQVSLPAMENIEPGMVQDSTISRKIFDFLKPMRDRDPMTEIDPTLNRTLVRSTDSVVVQRIDITNIR